MFVSDCININEKGHLTLGGCDTVSLAQEFGTPLYAFDEEQIRQNARAYKKSIDDNYGGNGLVLSMSYRAANSIPLFRRASPRKRFIFTATTKQPRNSYRLLTRASAELSLTI